VSTATTGTRERLLAAAQELIEEGGYGPASVIAIAARAGVAAGTLYRHFASKEELFVEVFRSVCEREERAMRAAGAEMPPGASAAERLETVLGTFAERALRNPRLAWALIAEPVDPLVDAERLAYRLLGFAVERGSRFVQQQDRRVLQERTRDRNTLPLAARKFHTAIPDHGRKPLRQGLDEIAARRDRRAQHLIVGRIRAPVSDVFHDRPMKQ